MTTVTPLRRTCRHFLLHRKTTGETSSDESDSSSRRSSGSGRVADAREDFLSWRASASRRAIRCALEEEGGSVKSNIGHLESAAGITGLIEAVMVLVYERAPPNIGLKSLNPLIEEAMQSHSFAIDFPLEVEPITAEEDGKLLVAGVSSFGYSGTIAHAIAQQAPKKMRRSVVGVGQCVAEDNRKSSDDVVFMVTGQGSQYAGMGKTLYHKDGDFREAMDRCAGIYKTIAGRDSLLDDIFNSHEEGLVATIAQPALVALQWSLVRMWQSN